MMGLNLRMYRTMNITWLLSLLYLSVLEAAAEVKCLAHLRNADTNHDGKLSPSEFVVAVESISEGSFKNIFLIQFGSLPPNLQAAYHHLECMCPGGGGDNTCCGDEEIIMSASVMDRACQLIQLALSNAVEDGVTTKASAVNDDSAEPVSETGELSREGETQVPISLTSGFVISNFEGITAADMVPGYEPFNQLQFAYDVLAEQLVNSYSNSVNITSVTYVFKSGTLDEVYDLPCPENVTDGGGITSVENATSANATDQLCMSVFASASIVLSDPTEDPFAIQTEYRSILQNLIDDDILDQAIAFVQGNGTQYLFQENGTQPVRLPSTIGPAVTTGGNETQNNTPIILTIENKFLISNNMSIMAVDLVANSTNYQNLETAYGSMLSFFYKNSTEVEFGPRRLVSIEDQACDPSNTSATQSGIVCQLVTASHDLTLLDSNQDADAFATDVTDLTNGAINDGQLQAALSLANPESPLTIIGSFYPVIPTTLVSNSFIISNTQNITASSLTMDSFLFAYLEFAYELLASFVVGEANETSVSFVDFSTSLESLADISCPPSVQPESSLCQNVNASYSVQVNDPTLDVKALDEFLTTGTQAAIESGILQQSLTTVQADSPFTIIAIDPNATNVPLESPTDAPTVAPTLPSRREMNSFVPTVFYLSTNASVGNMEASDAIKSAITRDYSSTADMILSEVESSLPKYNLSSVDNSTAINMMPTTCLGLSAFSTCYVVYAGYNVTWFGEASEESTLVDVLKNSTKDAKSLISLSGEVSTSNSFRYAVDVVPTRDPVVVEIPFAFASTAASEAALDNVTRQELGQSVGRLAFDSSRPENFVMVAGSGSIDDILQIGCPPGVGTKSSTTSAPQTIAPATVSSAPAITMTTAPASVPPAAQTTVSPFAGTVAPAAVSMAPAAQSTGSPIAATVAPAIAASVSPAAASVAPAVQSTVSPIAGTIAPAASSLAPASQSTDSPIAGTIAPATAVSPAPVAQLSGVPVAVTIAPATSVSFAPFSGSLSPVTQTPVAPITGTNAPVGVAPVAGSTTPVAMTTAAPVGATTSSVGQMTVAPVAPVSGTISPVAPTAAATTQAPVTPPVAGQLAPCPSIPDGGCSVCGDGLCVTNLGATFSFPGQPSVPCGTLQDAGYSGLIPLDQCTILPGLVADCECMNQIPVQDASPDSTPFVAPTAVPSISVTAPPVGENVATDAPFVISGVAGTSFPLPTTSTTVASDVASIIPSTANPTDIITLAPTVVITDALQDQDIIPEPSVTNSVPTVAPAVTVECPAVPENGCSVCGQGLCVKNPDAIFSYPFQPNVTCGSVQDDGYSGRIPPETCDVVYPDVVRAQCGCGIPGDRSAPLFTRAHISALLGSVFNKRRLQATASPVTSAPVSGATTAPATMLPVAESLAPISLQTGSPITSPPVALPIPVAGSSAPISLETGSPFSRAPIDNNASIAPAAVATSAPFSGTSAPVVSPSTEAASVAPVPASSGSAFCQIFYGSFEVLLDPRNDIQQVKDIFSANFENAVSRGEVATGIDSLQLPIPLTVFQDESLVLSPPTSAPSIAPSGFPTGWPTFEPTALPTTSPTGSTSPSLNPSLSPSPSVIPTVSQVPSSIPSSLPSGTPSNLPSSSYPPSGSSFPSRAPSSLPSGSTMPSVQPSRSNALSNLNNENTNGRVGRLSNGGVAGIVILVLILILCFVACFVAWMNQDDLRERYAKNKDKDDDMTREDNMSKPEDYDFDKNFFTDPDEELGKAAEAQDVPSADPPKTSFFGVALPWSKKKDATSDPAVEDLKNGEKEDKPQSANTFLFGGGNVGEEGGVTDGESDNDFSDPDEPSPTTALAQTKPSQKESTIRDQLFADDMWSDEDPASGSESESEAEVEFTESTVVPPSPPPPPPKKAEKSPSPVKKDMSEKMSERDLSERDDDDDEEFSASGSSNDSRSYSSGSGSYSSGSYSGSSYLSGETSDTGIDGRKK